MADRDYPDMLSPVQKFGAWLSDDELQFVEQVHNYVENEMLDRRGDFEGGWKKDEEQAIAAMDEVYADLVDLGLQESNLPDEYGGLGLSNQIRNAINEELSRADPGVATMVGKIHWLVGVIEQADHDLLRDDMYSKVTSGKPKTAAVLITEPMNGANIEDLTQEGRSIQVTAQEEGDGYLLNGHKQWGGPGGPAEHFQRENLDEHLGYFVVTNMEPEQGEEGIAIFYVPPDAEGLEYGEPYEKMGMAYTDRNLDYWFNDVRVPGEYRVDDPEDPMHAATILHGAIMAGGKLAGAARTVGAAQGAIEIGFEYTEENQIKGKSVRSRPLFANKFGELLRDLEAARSYYMTVGQMLTQPERHGQINSLSIVGRTGSVRSKCADTSIKILNEVMEMMGSYGYSYEGEVEKLLRDTKIIQLWLGGPQRDRLDMAYAYFDHGWEPTEDFHWHYE